MPILMATAQTSVGFSFLIFTVLLVILAASCTMFWLLIRRATSHRQWVTLSDWAQDNGFRFARRSDAAPPDPFAGLSGERRPRVRLQLARPDGVLFVQLERIGWLGDPRALKTSPWNLLIRPISTSWEPTGLRPAPDSDAATSFSAARSSLRKGDDSLQSLVELFQLPSYPLMRGSGRLLPHGADSIAARGLANSVVAALLPPDAGLLLHGNKLVIDFSRRPFDVLEFSRILALSDQVSSRLPAPSP